jgi:putative ABC transport system substrate-binding protein
MRKVFYGISAAVILAVLFAISGENSQQEIAVIVPLQHAAMDAIVEGLTSELGDQVPVHIYNAQGDSAIQSAIFQQLAMRNPAIVLPIGTAATLMAIERLPQANIIHLAAKFMDEDRAPHQKVTGVLDELPPENAVQMAALLIPNLKKVSLVYSASEKSFPEAAAFEAEAKRLGIAVQRLMIQSQVELYTMMQQVDEESQLVALLKDHMVVAGIATIVEGAQRRGIPVMAADEGSVGEGATFAAGVPESAIGTAGARLVSQVLAGIPVEELPILSVDDVHLFYRKETQSDFDFEGVAKNLGYRAEGVGS